MPERVDVDEVGMVAWGHQLAADVAESVRGTVLRGARPVPFQSSGVLTTGPGTLMGLNLSAVPNRNAPTVVRLYDGEHPDLNGDPIKTVRVPSGQTRTPWFGPSGISVQRGLYVDAGAQLGLVVADPATALTVSPGDQVLAATLVGAGYSVTLVDDAAAVPPGMDCFVISESISPATLGAKYTALPVPVVTLEIGGWDELGMSTVNGTNAAPASTTWDLAPHAITAALPDQLVMYGGLARAMWGADSVGNPLGAGVSILATHPAVPAHRVGFAYEAGAAMVVGNAPSRRVGLGIVENNADDLGADGKGLLLSSVSWALGGAAEAVTGFAYMRAAA